MGLFFNAWSKRFQHIYVDFMNVYPICRTFNAVTVSVTIGCHSVLQLLCIVLSCSKSCYIFGRRFLTEDDRGFTFCFSAWFHYLEDVLEPL